MLTYSIDRDLCKGCTLCLKKCPVDAIIGNKKIPHYIDQNQCTGCGQCLDVCRFNAVIAG
jgi:Na+-translocating ferredoxin:NAD+ oxidoreductase RNF subunit RnfB